ncbi:MAG TPA: FGGY-family carbohydrate kinase [Candidatus Caccousia avistercoris]|nr:FGGY-family carbohydrate kinase [Candidatus Caccousia avistercoris]
MMNRLLMGIDVGSTNIKAAVFTEQGTEIASHTVPNIPRQMDPEHESWLFWDPEELWGKVKQCMRECVKNSSSAGPVAAVAVTGMGMDGLPLDQEGNWLYPFISWKCSRTASTMEYWSQKLGTDKIFQISGKQPMAIDTLYRILWFREHKPELYGQTWKWLQIEDYINYKLSGCVVTDYSMASCTSLLDQRTRAWSKELLEAAGVKEEILPDIRASGSCIGTVSEETAKETGISPGAMVVLGGHDYSCAAVAAGVLEPGQIFDITGSWEMLYACAGMEDFTGKVQENGFKFESHVLPGRYAIFADVVSSSVLEWFKNQVVCRSGGGSDALWDDMIQMAQSADPVKSGVFFLPTLMGKGCPSIDPKAMGAFVGLDGNTSLGALCRAVFEGLNYQFREMLAAYEKISGRSVDQIIVCGGAAKNTFWMQNKADISGKTLIVPDNVETTLQGTALLAGVGCGCYPDAGAAFQKTARGAAVYHPQKTEYYDRYYEKYYLKLGALLKEFHHSIFQEFKA